MRGYAWRLDMGFLERPSQCRAVAKAPHLRWRRSQNPRPAAFDPRTDPRYSNRQEETVEALAQMQSEHVDGQVHRMTRL